jgi:hypothetical protein
MGSATPEVSSRAADSTLQKAHDDVAAAIAAAEASAQGTARATPEEPPAE